MSKIINYGMLSKAISCESVIVKSRATLEKYDAIKFFKENREKLAEAEKIIQWKNEVSNTLTSFL